MGNKQNFSDPTSINRIKKMIATLADGPKTLTQMQDALGVTKSVARSYMAHLVASQAAVIASKENRTLIYAGTGQYFPRASEAIGRIAPNKWTPVRDVMQIAFFGMGRA